SGLKATAVTGAAWPFRAKASSPEGIAHMFTVPSAQADASSFPSGLNATAMPSAVGPLRGRSTSRLCTAQSLVVPSAPPEARSWLSGLKATDVTHEECPVCNNSSPGRSTPTGLVGRWLFVRVRLVAAWACARHTPHTRTATSILFTRTIRPFLRYMPQRDVDALLYAGYTSGWALYNG